MRPPSASLALLLVSASALLAGCATQTAPSTSPTTAPSAPAPASPSIHWANCQQVHTFFPSPATGFAARVPAGFALAYQDAAQQTVQVVVFGDLCGRGRSDLVAAVGVVPPQAERNASLAVDALVLQVFTDNSTAHQMHLAAGLGSLAVLGTVNRARAAPGVDGVDASGDGLTYTLRAAIAPQQSPFAPAAYRYWVANGTRATGYLLAQNGNGTSLGMGGAALAIQGDPAAPPAAAGLAHRVSGATVAERFVPVTLKPSP